MNRNITKLGLVFLVIGILIFSGMNRSVSATTDTPKNATPYATTLKLKEKVLSKYDDVDLYLKTEETANYKIEMLTPVTKYKEINQLIKDWLTSEKKSFLNKQSELEVSKAELNIHMTLEKESKKYERLVFTINQTLGETTTHHKKVFNINPDKGETLPLNQLVDVSNGGLTTLQDIAFETLKEEDITVDEQGKEKASSSPDELNWSLNKDGLTFIFDGELSTPKQNNSIEVQVPFKELYLHVNENIAQFVKISEEQTEDMERAIEKEKQRLLEIKQAQAKREQEKKAAQKKHEQSLQNKDGKYVALTFDDGPDKTVTPRILQTLKDYNAKATFFMTGVRVSAYPEVANQVAQAGHELGNHTENHLDLTKYGASKVREEIQKTSDKITDATGVRPYLVRPPYGAYNSVVINDSAVNKNAIILWTVDSLDWQSRNPSAINSEVNRQITPGSIVLLHDIHGSTADALPSLLKGLQEQGYEFVTVSQLLKIQGKSGVGPFY